MGFGTVDFAGAYSNALKAAGGYVMSNQQCRSTYDTLTGKDMCVYSPDQNDTCQVWKISF